jgi:hypothetical protein
MANDEEIIELEIARYQSINHLTSCEHHQLINNRFRKRLAVECVEKRVDTAFQIVY